MNIKDTVTTLIRDGFILVFNQDKLDVVKTAQALAKAGINNMEVTCRIAKPLEKLSRLRRELPDFVAGAASMIDFPNTLIAYNTVHPDDLLPTVRQVLDSGANYLVSAANFSGQTYNEFAGTVPIIPGCGTVTEILDQFSKGANLCKVFPAKELGGPAFVKAVDPAIHKLISLVPTGGTTTENMGDYIDADVLVLGGSFSMIEKDALKTIIDRQDYGLLAEKFAEIKKLIDHLRAKKWPAIDFAHDSIEKIQHITRRNFNLK